MGLRKHSAWRGMWLCAACAAAAASPQAARVPVVGLLRALGAAGVNVLYSSDLVPDTLDAPDPRPHGDPLSRAVAALAANGLTLRRTGPSTYVVSRGTSGTTAPADAAPAAVPRAVLDELSVFASRTAFTTGADGEPIGFDDGRIDEVPGAKTDSVRALHTAPGVASNLSARPYVRGAMLDDVRVEFDGIALAEPFHFRNFQSVMSVFDPFAVARADVYTGGYPVNFGARSGGVIDLTPMSVPRGSEYSVGASLLSYNLETVGRSGALPLEWLLVARASSDDSVLQRFLSEPGEPSFYDVVGHLRWTVDAGSALTLGWLLLHDKVVFDSEPTEERATGRSHDSAAWLRWDWTPADALRGRSSLALSRNARDNSGSVSAPGIATGSLAVGRAFSTAALRSEWTYAPGQAMRLKFGGEFTHEQAELAFHRQEILADPIALAFGRPVNVSIGSDQSPRSTTLGLFTAAHGRWRDIEAELGLRFDRQDYRGYGGRGQLTPRINLRYDVAEGWRAYASWGQFAQAQRVDEYRAEANQTLPDPASRATHLIVGISHEIADDAGWRVEAYRNHWSVISPYFDNAFGPLPLLPQLAPDRMLIAPADADAAGLEISVRRAFGSGWSGWGAYSRSAVTDDAGGRDWPRSWDQPNAANVGVSWTRDRTSLSALLGWHTGWPSTPVSVVGASGAVPAHLVVGLRNASRWKDFFSTGLRLSTTVPLSFGDLSLWLDGTNLAGRSNPCCVELSPMNFTGPVPSAQVENWLPRVVNVGFSVTVRGRD